MTLTRENRCTRTKTCPIPTCYTKNPTWTSLESNPCCNDESPTTCRPRFMQHRNNKTFRKEIESFGPHTVEASINVFSQLCSFRELTVFWYTCKFYLKLKAAYYVNTYQTKQRQSRGMQCKVHCR